MDEKKSCQVLEHLKQNKSITAWDAIMLYRVTRLASIIYNLKKRGYDIETVEERNGSSRYARYVLRGDPK